MEVNEELTDQIKKLPPQPNQKIAFTINSEKADKILYYTIELLKEKQDLSKDNYLAEHGKYSLESDIGLQLQKVFFLEKMSQPGQYFLGTYGDKHGPGKPIDGITATSFHIEMKTNPKEFLAYVDYGTYLVVSDGSVTKENNDSLSGRKIYRLCVLRIWISGGHCNG